MRNDKRRKSGGGDLHLNQCTKEIKSVLLLTFLALAGSSYGYTFLGQAYGDPYPAGQETINDDINARTLPARPNVVYITPQDKTYGIKVVFSEDKGVPYIWQIGGTDTLKGGLVIFYVHGGTNTGEYGIECIACNGFDHAGDNVPGASINIVRLGILYFTSGSGEAAAHVLSAGKTATGNQGVEIGNQGFLYFTGNGKNYGVDMLASGGASVKIENYASGTPYLNDTGIGTFLGEDGFGNKAEGSVSITNHGTVDATAGAIFNVGSTTDSAVPLEISILGANAAKTSISTLDDYVGVRSGTGTVGDFSVKDDWKKYSHWDDGSILKINNVVNGSAVAQQLKTSFESVFGTGVTLQFTGSETTVAPAVVPDFTLHHVQELKDQGHWTAGGIITSEVLSAEKKDFSLADNGTWTEDIGFKGIKNATAVSVADGKTLTLLGGNDMTTTSLAETNAKSLAQSWALAARQHEGLLSAVADADETVTPNTVLSDAPVTLTSGNLTLGDNRVTATEGKMSTITADAASTVKAANGYFAIDTLSGSGKVVTEKKGHLTVGQLSAADISNSGVLTVGKDFSLSSGQKLVNEETGTVFLGNTSVGDDARITNLKGGTLNVGNLSLGALGTINNQGDLVANSLTLMGVVRNNGSITVNGTTNVTGAVDLSGTGDFGMLAVGSRSQTMNLAADNPLPVVTVSGANYSKELDLVSGFVTVKDKGILAGESFKEGKVGSQVSVENGGTFAFSYDKATLEKALKDAEKLTSGKAVAVLNTNITFDGGSLDVGSGASGATVNLGSDSLLLIGNSGSGVANLDLTGKTLSVADGATAAVGSDALWGNHYVLSGYDDAAAKEAAKLHFVDAKGKELSSGENERGLFVTVGSTNIADKDASYALQSNMNWMLDGRQDTNTQAADQRFLAQALASKDGVKATRDTAGFAAQSGLVSESLRLASTVHDTVASHVLSGRTGANSLWVEGLAGWNKASDAGFGSAYKSDTTGFALGADAFLSDGYRFGAAFSAQRTDLEGRDGNVSKNSVDSYGVSVYGANNFDSGLSVAAAASYVRGSSDAEQVNSLTTWKASPNTNAVVFGVRGAYQGVYGPFSVMPYIGADVKHLSVDSYRLGDAFEQEADSATVFSIPVGVRMGWAAPVKNGTLNTFVDLRATPSFGDTEVDVTTRGQTTHLVDAASFDAADKFLGEMKLGVGYQTQHGAFGVTYGLSKGTLRDLSQEFQVKGTLFF